MKNIIYFIIIFVFITNCTLNKATNHHGVYFLEKKQQKIFVNKTNNNDIIEILGPPSNTSNFNEKLWYYMERSSTSSKFTKLGNKELLTNNVLILELNKRGIVQEKIFLNMSDMKNINFTEDITVSQLSKRQTLIYDFLSSVRQKINNAGK
jgi:outer membrane protein assembly factor BamE (lipoprotein component of BamABCDE complex)